MRLGLIPDNLIDLLALISGKMLVPILESFWGIAVGKTVITGMKLGVFDALKEHAKTAQEIVKELDCNAQAMEFLLDALHGFGYLGRNKGYYSLTKKASRWLLSDSSSSMCDSILFLSELSREFDDLENSVRQGRYSKFHNLDKPPSFWRNYLRGLGTFARYAGAHLIRKIPLKKAPRRLLDVGGGHCLYTILLCERYPGLRAEVIDLKPAVEQGRKIIEEHKLGDRVSFRTGDLRTIDWGDDYDLILLFNILHIFFAEEDQEIFNKAYHSLVPGGVVVILDSEHPGKDKKLSPASGFNELLFFIINGTQIYPEKVIRGWMKNAGFCNIRKRKFLFMPMALFLTGEK